MSKIMGETKQKKYERSLKKKWLETDTKIRGQTKLTGGASTSYRLSDFEKEINQIVDDLI